jgi:Domain of unknown function (DUF4283)
MWATIDRGIWNFRNDVVASKKANGPDDLTEEAVKEMEVWVQLHNLPPKTLTSEGVGLLFSTVGWVLSEVKEIHINGQKSYKAKLGLALDRPLQDRIETRHPEGGHMLLALVYEKVRKAC